MRSNILGALIVGAVAGAACAYAVGLKFKFGLDDSLDVVGVHLVGGLIGSCPDRLRRHHTSPQGIDGLFGDINGLFYGGDATLLGHQILAALFTVVWTGVFTTVIALAIKYTIGWRITEEDEVDGHRLRRARRVGVRPRRPLGWCLGGSGPVAAAHAKTESTEGAIA